MTHGSPALGTPVFLARRPASLNLAIDPMVTPPFSGHVPQSELMTRRVWISLALALAGCRRSAPPVTPFLESMDGGWRRAALAELPVSEAPDPVPRTAVKRLTAARYEGPGRLEARAYELTSSTTGVDLAQRWRPSADTVFFSRGSYFVVVKWQAADRSALQAFVRNVEKTLQPRP